MILVELSAGVGVWLTAEENNLYRRIKFNSTLLAEKLSSNQLEVARSLINKSVLSRKKQNGKLYYTISNQVNT